MGKQIDEATRIRNPDGEFTFITIGEVVDTNDPQQMGRLRVACPLLGDSGDDVVSDIPWATYVSPLGGTATSPSRGRGGDVTAGQIAYGMFNVPKVGSNVLVACIDADPRFRVWLGCVHDQFLTHTMPHGRYSYKTANKPEGPFSSSEDKIQPLYDSQTAAFTNPDGGVEPRMSHEFRTRAADVGVAGLDDELVNIEESNISLLSDDVDEEYGVNPAGGKYSNTQGYQKSRVEDGESSNTGGIIYDPQTYSWTTPGFHSLSMQDNAENCRIRFRTTHGHQIIMDDTNERIYISTAGGKTWIEMDEVGNIDIYGERNISVHAKKDINYTADESFRVNAKNIHFNADEDIRIQSKGGTGIGIKSVSDIHIQSDANIHIKSGVSLFLSSDDSVHIDATESGLFTASFGALNLSSTGDNVLVTGTEVHLNGPPAAAADTAEDGANKNTYATSRIPQHEPWARTMTDPTVTDNDDTTNTVVDSAELPYDSDDVGRKERDEPITRNPLWHR